jgi:adenine-specific DNA methylase
VAEQASFALRGRNPDVLTCIANLSNDEVFTPPELANQMLDTLAEAWAEANGGATIWKDSKIRFLDPVTKSGVFLREIAKRLVEGLAEEIPDLNTRVDHILTKQVYGIAITQLTSLLARRSLYCSKWANGPHSIATSFETADGNIWFKRVEHTWKGGRCTYCRASQGEFGRAGDLETHAYAFIHTDDINARLGELFGGEMQFDVIIGNPPYQLADEGHGASASTIYHEFVEQAISLDPRYVVMVTPSRWFSGGKGVDDFRSFMLTSGKVRNIVDFPNSAEVFPSVDIKGGV